MRKLSLCVIGLALLAACGNGGDDGPSGVPSDGYLVPDIVVVTQPVGGLPGGAFTTQPVIELRTPGSGALRTADNATVVTASIIYGTGAGGATLGGTTSVTAVDGVVTFTDLSIDIAGAGYRLRFTAIGGNPGTSNAFNVGLTGGTLITPGTPPASDYSFNIHSQQDVSPISRWIYGMNGIDWGQRPHNLTFGRSGGNRLTAWNWENNASNAGEDWFNQNDWLLGDPTDPIAYTATSMINANRANNAGSLVTVPCIGYVAADHGHYGGAYPSGDVNQTANYLTVRFKQSVAKKGSAFTLTPSTTDGFVYQDEFVNFIGATYPGYATHATQPVFYSLDNEPDLWASTHPRLRGAATGSSGTGPTYAEMLNRTRDYADAIKDVEPNAIVFGPVNYGWQGMVDLQGASDAATHGDFHTYYLQQLAAAEAIYSHRLVDVLDIHWYPEAGANNAGGTWTRITADNADPLVAAARMQAPRSLWDTTYTEDSWVAQWGTSGPIYLLPRIQAKINAHYPNTRIGVTEYYYGGGDHISGGIAQADVLGIFGREGVFAANLWRLGSGNHNFIYGAFEMFRNYDANNGSFGNTSIQALSSNNADTSVYASIDAGNPDRMVIVCINKTNQARTAGIAITHSSAFNMAEVYQLTSSNGSPVRVADLNITQTNAFQYTMPAYSVTTLVLTP